MWVSWNLPCSPGIDVANGYSSATIVAEDGADLIDLLGKTSSGSVTAIQILRSNADTAHPASTVLLDGVGEGILLIGVVGVVCGPNASQQLDASILRSWNGIGESVAIAAGVDSYVAELAGKGFHLVEIVCPVCLVLAGSIWLFASDVETALTSADSAGKGERENRRKLHLDLEMLDELSVNERRKVFPRCRIVMDREGNG